MHKKYGIQRLDTKRFLPEPFRYDTLDESLKALEYIQGMLYDLQYCKAGCRGLFSETPKLVIGLVNSED